jgi:hypothetical protein
MGPDANESFQHDSCQQVWVRDRVLRFFRHIANLHDRPADV